MMRHKALTMVCLMISMFSSIHSAPFIKEQKDFKKHSKILDIVLISSPGRSGSTMLTKQLEKYIPGKVLKTHRLPPNKKYFKGKILFIFSNPDLAAESALYKTLHQFTPPFGERHFRHVETADRSWLAKIGGPFKQNDQHNILSYDAFGTYEHLKVWLFDRTQPTKFKNAQILAIKYEHLWDNDTLEAIRDFLGISEFELPTQLSRGNYDLNANEKRFRKLYNLGTKNEPRYAAYDEARLLWEQAPPFQYLKIK